LDVGQPPDVVQELAQLLAMVADRLGRGGRADEDPVVRHQDGAAYAQVGHAGVVRDPVQPGPERVRLGAATQRRDREDEDLLLDSCPYRVTRKVRVRAGPSEAALRPARISIAYTPGFSADSFELRSVTRNRPAERGVRVVVNRARPVLAPLRAL